jgi:cell division protein FtsN
MAHYKDPPSSRASGPSHPLLLGIIIGALLGILISLAVALWLNRLSNPFMEKARPVPPLPQVQPVPPSIAPESLRSQDNAAKPPESAAPSAAPPAASAPQDKARTSERPRYEFYQIVPGETPAAGAQGKPKEATARPGAARPGSSPSSPKPHAGDVYWLQAGAFTDSREADNQKAKIALTGLEASVRPVDVPGRGTLYRVRLGPYESVDDANRMKTVLARNGVTSTIIRTNDDAKTP